MSTSKSQRRKRKKASPPVAEKFATPTEDNRPSPPPEPNTEPPGQFDHISTRSVQVPDAPNTQ